MTQHLTDETLAAALDRGGSSIAESVRLHVMECESCRKVLAAATIDDAEVGKLFGLLDHEPPATAAEEFASRIASHRNAVRASSRRNRTRSWNLARWAGAAGLFTASVAAAALIPNSPVQRLVRFVIAASYSDHSPMDTARKAVNTSPLPRGVEIIPHGRVEVLFRSTQAAGTVHVVPSTSPQLSVEGDGDGATFTVGESTIVVNNRPSDSISYIVRLPLTGSADAMSIRIAGSLVYSNSDNTSTPRLHAGSGNQYILDLKRPQR